ncbi:MAG: hypothetical protein JWN86_1663 [Planctomycetota bacterium]|nr:hypothetical protein [Planctomycetota bacterium]
MVLFRTTRRNLAAEELKKAAALDTNFGPAGPILASLYMESGEGTKAEKCFQAALTYGPTDPRVHMAFASWLVDRGRIDEAEAHAEQAEKYAPTAVEPRLLRGQILLLKKDFQRAEQTFQALHVESPTDAGIGGLWALSLVEQSDPVKKRRAQKVCDLVLRLAPSSPDAIAVRGVVALRSGIPEDAERYLSAAAGSGPLSADLVFEFARYLAERGRAGEAKPLLEAAIAAKGRFLHRQEAQSLMTKIVKEVKGPGG